MDLKYLFTFLSEKGFNYFDGQINNEKLFLNFSTGYNGRGNAVELVINNNDNSNVKIYLNGVDPYPLVEKENIEDNEVLRLLKENL